MDEDDHRLIEVHFGDLAHELEDTHPVVGGLLHQADQRRAATIAVLRSEESGTLGALNAAGRFLFGLVDWVEQEPKELAAEFASRLVSDFIDAVDGVLEQRTSAVMDACRDLMELAVLFREFRRLPQRFDRWKDIDEVNRIRDFSFGKLLRKHHEEPIDGLTDIDAALAEYTAHSRTLHPAVPLTHPDELTRSPAPVPVDPAAILAWARSMSAETLRHSMIAATEFLLWNGSRVDGVEVPFDDELTDYTAVREWYSTYQASASIPDEVREAWESPYRHKKGAHP